jgi:hypothetical protein
VQFREAALGLSDILRPFRYLARSTRGWRKLLCNREVNAQKNKRCHKLGFWSQVTLNLLLLLLLLLLAA